MQLLFDADFADLLEVKLGGPTAAEAGAVTRRLFEGEGLLEIDHTAGQATGIRVSGRPDELSTTGAVFPVTLALRAASSGDSP